MAQIRPPVSLHDVKFGGMRVPALIEPDSFVESHPINHQSIVFPGSRVMSVPTRVRIFRMAAVQVHLVKPWAFVVVNDDQIILTLDHLKQRPKSKHSSGK